MKNIINSTVQAIILAGGKSTRFKTGRSKLAETICGQEMIIYSTKLIASLHIPAHILIGFEKEIIIDLVTKYHGTALPFIEQKEQKGTGHAVACTQPIWTKDHILIMNADMPLVKAETIEKLLQLHADTDAAISFVTAHNPDPSLQGYGRVVQQDAITKIIEAKDFKNFDAQEHCCINAGIYLFKRDFLAAHINKLTTNNASHEFYLTDLIELACLQGLTVTTLTTSFDEVRGINTLRELWTAEQIKRSDLMSYWMDNGVRFHAAQSTHIDSNVTIGAGSYIGQGTHIINGSSIGKNSIIECFSVLSNATIGDNAVIRSHSVIYDSTIEADCQIGPFAHVEAKSIIDEQSCIGNFVQVKRSTLGKNTKAKHLAFLGDAIVGNNVNIGAGTITCNYDGVTKHPTVLQDHCFIGSNSTLVAPVIIGAHAFTAAGSVITDDVPAEALALGRARQVTKENYAQKLRAKKESKTNNQTSAQKQPIDTNNSSL